MREIKFRAWEKDLGMVDIPLGVLSQQVCEPITLNEALVPFHGVLMQYTGLKDKNGKEIYEGDIIRFQRITQGETILAVKWDEETGFFPFTECSYPRIGYECGRGIEEDTVEVIGNIYENPELLKGGDIDEPK